jgi:hypothetical protein
MSKNPPFQRNIQADMNNDFWDDIPESQHEDPTTLFKQSVVLDDPSLMSDENALGLDQLKSNTLKSNADIQSTEGQNEDWQSVSKKLNVALTPELWVLLNELHEQAQALGLQVSRAQMIRIAVQHFQMAWLNHKENTQALPKKRNTKQKISTKAKDAPSLSNQDEDEWQIDSFKKPKKS